MLNLNQRDLLSKGLLDAGKLSLATLVFGQFVKREPVNVFIFLIGATATIASYYIAVKILKED